MGAPARAEGGGGSARAATAGGATAGGAAGIGRMESGFFRSETRPAAAAGAGCAGARDCEGFDPDARGIAICCAGAVARSAAPVDENPTVFDPTFFASSARGGGTEIGCAGGAAEIDGACAAGGAAAAGAGGATEAFTGGGACDGVVTDASAGAFFTM